MAIYKKVDCQNSSREYMLTKESGVRGAAPTNFMPFRGSNAGVGALQELTPTLRLCSGTLEGRTKGSLACSLLLRESAWFGGFGRKQYFGFHQRAHPDLNQGPADLQSAALTTELCTRLTRSSKLQLMAFSP